MIDGSRLKYPLNPEDVYRLLGIGQYNGGWNINYICSNNHGRINMWSRYKPVSLRTIFVSDTFNNETMRWAEVPYTGIDKWNNNPWFYGSNQDHVFTVPFISELKEIGADGVQKEDTIWTYNPPYGGDWSPYRLDDFLGYNHYAKVPISTWMANDIKFNKRFLASISETDTDNYNGEFTFSEILNFAFNNQPIYAGIGIWNKTRNLLTGFVKKEPLGDQTGAGEFSLDPMSGELIENGGFSQLVRVNDIVDVYLFLSQSAGDTDVATTTKLSAYLDKSCICYRRFTVGYDYLYVTVKFHFGTLMVDIVRNVNYYLNDYDNEGNGTIYKISQFITGIHGSFTAERTQKSDYRTFSIVSQGTAKGIRADGTTFDASSCPDLSFLTLTDGNFNNANYTRQFSGSGEARFIAYRSLSDAQNMVNGFTLNGIPIYDRIEYNGDEYDDVGSLSNRVVKLGCRGFSSLQYTILTYESTDNNNILYQN
ncbi:hypothetical protein [Bacteroides nordii]|uniref:hypothetical protein n=1 Tax=Bacteroides nordii TaxID=291645 RepID=UPI0034A4C28F